MTPVTGGHICHCHRWHREGSEIDNVIQHSNNLLALWKAYGLESRLVVVCIQTMVCSIKGELACTWNSVKFSYITQYKSVSFILTWDPSYNTLFINKWQRFKQYYIQNGLKIHTTCPLSKQSSK